MRVKIIKNEGNPFYDEFIGTEHKVLEYNFETGKYKLPIESFNNPYCYWHKSEVEVIKEE